MLKKLILFNLIALSVLANSVKTDHAEVELISEVNSVAAGQPFWVALHISHENEWHTYWRNAGDAGIETRFKWTLPYGFKASEINWPFPHRIMLADVANYGYEGELYLLTQITPPTELDANTNIEITLNATWLICKEECLPGGAELNLSLPVGQVSQINDKNAGIFTTTREKLPIKNHEWKTTLLQHTDSSITINAIKPEWVNYELGDVNFFPYTAGFIKNSANQKITLTEKGFTIELSLEEFIVEKPEVLEGILFSETGWRGENSEKAIEISVPLAQTYSDPESTTSDISLLLALFFAFAGGIILNLMPCVLPVLSIKILGFVQQAGEDLRKVRKHGFYFTLGVLFSFLFLAGLLLLLRAGGEQLGWGFQLQSPLFLIILSVLLLLFSLSLFGVFEVGNSAAKFGGRIENQGGNLGAILSGVAATILATPCTAPFMGSALGFAITQPAWTTLLVFTFLGLGMAFPYLLLSIFPQWLKFLPKPGMWMETLKQFMGFLLLATILWLAWVLSIQSGSEGVIGLMTALFLSGLAGWIYGKWGSLVNSQNVRIIATASAFIIVTGSIVFANSFIQNDYQNNSELYSNKNAGLKWEKFSDQRLNELLKAERNVFIDFTAAWCLSCQVNEKIALNNPEVINKFEELNVIMLKADWTSRDTDITEALARFGRNSVPLYVLFNGKKDEPKLLPEILTPGIILEELNNL